MSDVVFVGDRVKVANWPTKPGEPDDVNGLEGTVKKFHEPYVVVDLDTPPDWFEIDLGLYCRPDELEKL